MPFSCKIILASHKKNDGSRMVYLQAIIDRSRAEVSLGFYVSEEMFDKRRQSMKPQHLNAKDFDVELMQAVAKANSIASRYRAEGTALTPLAFRNEFRKRSADVDFIKFFSECLILKRPSMAHNTFKSHTTILHKLQQFRQNGLLFSQVNMELLQRFRNFLIEKETGDLP